MISLCVCTHNPRPGPLARCLEALRRQTIPESGLELVVIDNGSQPGLTVEALGLGAFPYPARVVAEPRLGLTQARLRALRETRGATLVFVDDDNVLDPDYAVVAERFMASHAHAGAASGRSVGEFEVDPPSWCDAQVRLSLALRDLGESTRPYEGVVAPLGAGLVIRRAAFEQATLEPFILGDRRGTQLSSGGDSELCHRLRVFGWELWYLGELRLTHLINRDRLTIDYLERLHLGFGRDWPFLEFYWLPARPWRRMSYARRAWRLHRTLRQPARFEEAPSSPGAAAARLQRSYDRGMAETLLRLVWGPAHWRVVERLRGHATTAGES